LSELFGRFRRKHGTPVVAASPVFIRNIAGETERPRVCRHSRRRTVAPPSALPATENSGLIPPASIKTLDAMATFNSGPHTRHSVNWPQRLSFSQPWESLFADEGLIKSLQRAPKRNFTVRRLNFQSNTNTSTIAWKFARACFDFADFATNNTERVVIARQGIAACRQLIVREPGIRAGSLLPGNGPRPACPYEKRSGH